MSSVVPITQRKLKQLLLVITRSQRINPSGKASLARLWRDSLPPVEYFCVCSEHFTEDCFIDDLKSELIPAQTINRGMKRDATRSMFSITLGLKSRRTSERCADTVFLLALQMLLYIAVCIGSMLFGTPTYSGRLRQSQDVGL